MVVGPPPAGSVRQSHGLRKAGRGHAQQWQGGTPGARARLAGAGWGGKAGTKPESPRAALTAVGRWQLMALMRAEEKEGGKRRALLRRGWAPRRPAPAPPLSPPPPPPPPLHPRRPHPRAARQRAAVRQCAASAAAPHCTRCRPTARRGAGGSHRRPRRLRRWPGSTARTPARRGGARAPCPLRSSSGDREARCRARPPRAGGGAAPPRAVQRRPAAARRRGQACSRPSH